MLFIAEFGRHADKPDAFRQALQPHLDYLEAHKDKVLLSATKHAAEDGKVRGFVWIIEAQDADEARCICEQDPFWTADLRTSFQLSSLTKALPDHVAKV